MPAAPWEPVKKAEDMRTPFPTPSPGKKKRRKMKRKNPPAPPATSPPPPRTQRACYDAAYTEE
jgi:hypothetical protein